MCVCAFVCMCGVSGVCGCVVNVCMCVVYVWCVCVTCMCMCVLFLQHFEDPFQSHEFSKIAGEIVVR